MWGALRTPARPLPIAIMMAASSDGHCPHHTPLGAYRSSWIPFRTVSVIISIRLEVDWNPDLDEGYRYLVARRPVH